MQTPNDYPEVGSSQRCSHAALWPLQTLQDCHTDSHQPVIPNLVHHVLKGLRKKLQETFWWRAAGWGIPRQRASATGAHVTH